MQRLPARTSLSTRVRNLPVLASSLDRWLLTIALLTGFAERLRVAGYHFTFGNSEAGGVAMAIANGRGFADPYFVGQGPTAHLMPISPLIAGGLMRIFGTGHLGTAVLLGVSLLVTFSAFAVASYCIYLVSRHLRTAVLAFCLMAMLPLHLFSETVYWRVWDNGLGTLLGLCSLAVVLRGERETVPHFVLWKAILPAAAFIVNPITGISAGASAALSSLRHRRRDGIVIPFVLAAVCVVLVLTPWTIRNAIVMKAPILTRDNLGIELSLANEPNAVHPVDEWKVHRDRLAAIHPYEHPTVQRRMAQAGGEIAYNQMLLAETKAWMRDHPQEVRIIWARHARQLLFPSPWMFESTHERFTYLRSGAAAIISTLALLGLAAAMLRRDWIYGYLAILILIPIMLGLPFRPNLRYCWVMYPLLASLAVDFVIRLVQGTMMRAAKD